jgi:uncharacterized membrane protein
MLLDQLISQRRVKEKRNDASERPIRSIVKAVSWRVVGTLDTITISWLLSGEMALAFSIGSIELLTKMVLYFFHERAWNQVKWGK